MQDVVKLQERDWQRKNGIMCMAFEVSAGLTFLLYLMTNKETFKTVSMGVCFLVVALAFLAGRRSMPAARVFPVIVLTVLSAATIASSLFSVPSMATLGIIFFIIGLSSLHAHRYIMIYGGVLSIIALYAFMSGYPNAAAIAGSKGSLTLILLLLNFSLFLQIRQSRSVFGQVQEYVKENAERAIEEQNEKHRLHEGVQQIMKHLTGIREAAAENRHSQEEMLNAVQEVSSGSQKQADQIADIAESASGTNKAVHELEREMETIIDQAKYAGEQADGGAEKMEMISGDMEAFKNSYLN